MRCATTDIEGSRDIWDTGPLLATICWAYGSLYTRFFSIRKGFCFNCCLAAVLVSSCGYNPSVPVDIYTHIYIFTYRCTCIHGGCLATSTFKAWADVEHRAPRGPSDTQYWGSKYNVFYTQIHIYMCTYNNYIRRYTHIHIIYICIYIYVCICVCAHIYIHTHLFLIHL